MLPERLYTWVVMVCVRVRVSHMIDSLYVRGKYHLINVICQTHLLYRDHCSSKLAHYVCRCLLVTRPRERAVGISDGSCAWLYNDIIVEHWLSHAEFAVVPNLSCLSLNETRGGVRKSESERLKKFLWSERTYICCPQACKVKTKAARCGTKYSYDDA